jgi:MoaA/NifB/PqqE/SkfB family radical SAM enzyme
MSDILNKIEMCGLFTGTNGRRGCTGNCTGCYVGTIEVNHSMYQGKEEQVYELIDLLPNLKHVLLFGNPDPSVDPNFCNKAARILQSKGIQVLFISNGVGGIDVIKKIIDGLDTSLIFEFGFSIDSLDEKKNSTMRGTKISLPDVFQSMEYLKSMGVNVKTSFTVWPKNMDEDWESYVKFFESRDVNVDHGFGCIQASQGRVTHVPEKELIEMRNKYSGIKLATILANDDEYAEYFSTYVSRNKLKCVNLKNITAYFTQSEIKATYLCTILSTIYPEYLVNVRDLPNIKTHAFYDETIKTGYCPASKEALGFESTNLHPICRYYKKIHGNSSNLPRASYLV